MPAPAELARQAESPDPKVGLRGLPALRRLLSAEAPEGEGLAAIGISLHEVRETIEEAFGPDALNCDGRLPFRADAKRALELALRETVELRQRRIGTTELLLGLLREPSR